MDQDVSSTILLNERRSEHSLPGSMAAEMRDCASRTLFMASSISLLEASFFIPGFMPSPAANGFILKMPSMI